MNPILLLFICSMLLLVSCEENAPPNPTKRLKIEDDFPIVNRYKGFPFEGSLFEKQSNCLEVYGFRTNRDEFREVKSTYIDGLIQKSRDSLYLECFLITIDTADKEASLPLDKDPKKEEYIDFMATAFFGRNLRPYLSEKKSNVVGNSSELGLLLNRFTQLSTIIDSPKEGTNLFSLSWYTEEQVKEWNSFKIDHDPTITALENLLVKTCACGHKY